MTKESYKTTAECVVYLCSCAVNSVTPEKECVAGVDLDELYKIAEFHSLVSAVAMALSKIGIKNEKFGKAHGNAIRKAVLTEAEKEAVFSELEKAEVRYLPLKGAIIKDMYPSVGMRQMADFDILYDPEKMETVKKIMVDRGYKAKSVGIAVHDVYHKDPFYNFEFHRILFLNRTNTIFHEYFGRITERLIKDEDNDFGYHLSDEDFYIYLIAHENKHYMSGGTGLRSLLDTYVYLKKCTEMNREYLDTEFEKLKLTEFEKQNRSLSFHLFDGEELTPEDQKMLRVILSSGTYGTINNRINKHVTENGGGFKGKLSYFMNRVFLPMEAVRDVYPFFYRHKIFLPVLFPYRVITSIARGKGKIKSELIVLSKKQKNSDEK